MTFETARMRRESEMLLGSKPQLTQAMRVVSAVAGVAQSATTATSAHRVLDPEGLKTTSKTARARMPTVVIYPGPMRGAIETAHNTHASAEKCLVPTSHPYAASSTSALERHFGGRDGS